MKLKISSYQPQYIVDQEGKRKSVIFEIQNFEKFIEEIEDMYFGALAEKEFKKKSATMTHDQVKKLLKAPKKSSK